MVGAYMAYRASRHENGWEDVSVASILGDKDTSPVSIQGIDIFCMSGLLLYLY